MAALKTIKEFKKEFNDLISWIRDSVVVFQDDSPEAKAERIKRSETDKEYFAKTYFPHYIEDDFAPMHKEMFAICDIWKEPIVIAGAREVAKSTVISFFDELHKTVFKKNKFTVFVSDTEDTAISEFLFPIRAELEANPRLINDFGDFKTPNWAINDFITKTGKRFLALSPKMGAKGKRNRGFRPDRIILEDIENANSPKKKSIVNRKIKWINKDLRRAVNSKKWQFIFIGNYFSKKTIIHQLLTSDDFKHYLRYIFPAAKLDEATRKVKSLWESRLPSKELQEEFDDEPSTFRTERLQKPEDEEATFKEEWIRWVLPETIPNLDKYNLTVIHLQVVTYVDPSAGKGEEHCFKSIVTLAVDSTLTRKKYYVLNVWLKKTTVSSMVMNHVRLSNEFKSSHDGIESNGFQVSLKELYEAECDRINARMNIKMVNNQLSKEVRISRLQPLVEKGDLVFVDNSDQRLLVEQLIDFPDGEFVDGPDSLAGAVELADRYVLKKRNKAGAKVV